MIVKQDTVPLSARVLGGSGAIPFVALAVATAVLNPELRVVAGHALVAYGAVILSFLGGVHWGLAIGAQPALPQNALTLRLGISVVPSLVAWVALLGPARLGLLGLGVAVATMLWVDVAAVRTGFAPRWYARLRVALTCVVVACLTLGWVCLA